MSVRGFWGAEQGLLEANCGILYNNPSSPVHSPVVGP